MATATATLGALAVSEGRPRSRPPPGRGAGPTLCETTRHGLVSLQPLFSVPEPPLTCRRRERVIYIYTYICVYIYKRLFHS